jgi:hypothetical protein
MVSIKYGFVDHTGAEADILKDSRSPIESVSEPSQQAGQRMGPAAKHQ